MDICPLLPECQKLFLTGPGILRRAERKEASDGLQRTSCDSSFHSKMVLGKNECLYVSTREETAVNVSESEYRELRRGQRSELHGIAERP